MAVAQSVETVKVTINEVEIDVPKGELIVEAVKRLGLEIPVFCYHPRMKPVGMCRMCLVDVGFKQPDGSVRMMPKPQAGCTLPASDGMVVYTDSENVHRDRRGVLEFLLVNHPLDCPICDRGGECPLQNNTLAYGPSTSRFIEHKRHLPKAFPLSKYVTLDLERCIQCGRCVRFTEEISGEHELAFRFRGASMQPSTFQLLDFESKFSGNVIEICPVGALTSARYRFRARPWDLETSPAVCTRCSVGCNVWFDHRVGKFVRINGRINESVNEEWTCDRGKFGHDGHNSPKRLTKPLIRKGEQFVESTWAEAYEVIAQGFSRPGAEVAGLSGDRVSNEGLYLFKKLFRDTFESPNTDHRWRASAGRYEVNSTIAGLENASSVLVFATDLAAELPIVYLRLRKAAINHGVPVVVLTEKETELDSFATLARRLQAGKEGEAAKSLDGDVLKTLGANPTILVAESIFDSPQAEVALDALRSLPGAVLNVLPTGANAMGAQLLDVMPGSGGLDTNGMLKGLSSGSVKSVWLVECDAAGTAEGARALENAEFVVYQGTIESETMSYASVVLPMAMPAEQEGSWTNCEGRWQWMEQAIPAPGEAKPAWRIFAETILRMTPSTPFFNAREVMLDIVGSVPAFAGLDIENFDAEGVLVGRQPAPVMAGEGV